MRHFSILHQHWFPSPQISKLKHVLVLKSQTRALYTYLWFWKKLFVAVTFIGVVVLIKLKFPAPLNFYPPEVLFTAMTFVLLKVELSNFYCVWKWTSSKKFMTLQSFNLAINEIFLTLNFFVKPQGIHLTEISNKNYGQNGQKRIVFTMKSTRKPPDFRMPQIITQNLIFYTKNITQGINSQLKVFPHFSLLVSHLLKVTSDFPFSSFCSTFFMIFFSVPLSIFGSGFCSINEWQNELFVARVKQIQNCSVGQKKYCRFFVSTRRDKSLFKTSSEIKVKELLLKMTLKAQKKPQISKASRTSVKLPEIR